MLNSDSYPNKKVQMVSRVSQTELVFTLINYK